MDYNIRDVNRVKFKNGKVEIIFKDDDDNLQKMVLETEHHCEACVQPIIRVTTNNIVFLYELDKLLDSFHSSPYEVRDFRCILKGAQRQLNEALDYLLTDSKLITSAS